MPDNVFSHGLAAGGRAGLWLQGFAGACVAYLATNVLISVAILMGPGLQSDAERPKHWRHVPPIGNPLVDTLTLWDGQWYLEIAARGYTYHAQGQSAVAFFPAYPAMVRALLAVAPLPLPWAGLAVSHAVLLAAYALLMVYVRQRFPQGPPALAPYCLAALAVFPTSLFMRMAYTESLFLALCLAAMLGMERRWPLGIVALVIGAATATRAVGVALLLPLAMHARKQSGSWRRAAGRLVWPGPLAVWGLALYVAYQAWAFGEPWGFVKTQQYWRMRPPAPAGDTLLALLSWEPIWSVYLRGAPGYWGDIDRGVPLVLSYHSANCVVFVGAAVLLAVGAAKDWLSGRELALGAALLAIPYFLAGYRFCMGAQGRYASVVFPIYLVLGQLLCRLPRPVAVGLLAFLAGYLAWFTAMLAAGYLVI